MPPRAGLDLTISVFGEKQISRRLGIYIDNATDLRPAWALIREDFQDNNKKQFTSQGRHGSGGWRPLSPAYGAWKAKHYPGKTILRRTDRLFGSLTTPMSLDAIYIPSRQSVTLGTAVPYAIYHGLGTRTMPRRRPVELTEGQKRGWTRIIQKAVFDDRGEFVRVRP